MAVDSDGAVYQVEFEGKSGAWWEEMERAFDEKQAFRSGLCTGSSWTRLPVRVRSAFAIANGVAMVAVTLRGRRRRRRLRALARRPLWPARNGSTVENLKPVCKAPAVAKGADCFRQYR
jgi:hypothetical protein